MRTRFLAMMALVSILAASVNAQTPPAQPAPDVAASVYLEDGSMLHARLLTPSLTVETPYGSLVIPCSEIRTVSFGLHLSPDEEKSIAAAIRALGSTIFLERDKASRVIASLGRRAIPALDRTAKSPDAEVSKRADLIKKAITEADARPVPGEDVVITAKIEVRGIIRTESLSLRSLTLGDFAVKLPNLERLIAYNSQSSTFSMDAAHYGSGTDKWFSTGTHLQTGLRLRISAHGMVDIFPQTPGQYTAEPQGHQTIGKGGQFPAGALIGKIGEHGSVFRIGAGIEKACAAGEEGTLFLQIVGSPWSCPSVGNYTVTVKINK